MSDISQFTPINDSSFSAGGMTQAASEHATSRVQPLWSEMNPQLTETAKILMVDDEEMNIDVVQSYLEMEGYRRFFRTTDATQAIALIEKTRPDVVLLDIMMPAINGLEILAAMRADQELFHIPVVILTACTDGKTKLEALKLGLSDFLAKPVDASELVLRIRNVLAMKAYQDRLANHSLELEEQVRVRTQEVVESRQRIIHCLARAAEFRDDDTGHHVMRVGKYAGVLAGALGFDSQYIEILEQAAQLHDIGKIGVPDAILLKKGKLDPDEFDVVKRHCSFGSSIINPMSAGEFVAYQGHAELGAKLLDFDGYPVMEMAAIIAQTHHEKWDGSGYPLGLAGEDIPIEGRITAVADVFDALSTKRPYKPAFSRDKCFQILEEGRNTHFDANILDAFFSCSNDIIAVQIRFADV